MKKGQRLGELCKLLDLQPYVLRYWITEFAQLGGAESASAPNRVFSAHEVATIRRIQQLLYEEGYTIAGAKKKLESEPVSLGSPRRKGATEAPLFDDGEPAEAADSQVQGDSPSATEEIEDESVETAKGDSIDAGESAEGSLDTGSDERIETFRREVEAALSEARAILEQLRTPRR